MKHGREKENIKKRSVLYIIKTTQKIERKRNERNSAFVLGVCTCICIFILHELIFLPSLRKIFSIFAFSKHTGKNTVK